MNTPDDVIEDGTRDYERVERAIRFLEANVHRQPGLAEVARVVSLSEYHFQRLFSRWAGVSPKRFLQFVTAGHARRLLAESASVLDASYELGLSSGSRLHDLLVNVHAMTPGQVRTAGAGLTIEYGFHPTPFGRSLVATTDRGICSLSFLTGEDDADALGALSRSWERARLKENVSRTGRLADAIFSRRGRVEPIHIHVKGTNFQLRVWEALLRIPPGAAVTYGGLADRIGASGSARAVGSAVARNPVAYLIPCHRVIRAGGVFGDYRWGSVRKKVLLAHEAVAPVRDSVLSESPSAPH